MGDVDTLNVNGKWKFDESVTNVFSNMLERSIPQYDVMRDSVFNLGCQLLDKQTYTDYTILDLGCSNGLSLERFIKKYGENAKYIGVDNSEPMVTEARERFKPYNQVVEILNYDFKHGFDITGDADLVLSVLTLQFIPIEYRQQVIQNIYDVLSPTGGFIMVEKVLGNSAYLNELFIEEYLNMKKINGYTNEQIERKQLSLEGVLVPMTSNWNVDMLKQAGFKYIDTFWRWMNFEGVVCIK